MKDVLVNIGIMVLSVGVLLGAGYVALMVLEWGLKLKGGRREQEGLFELWRSAQTGPGPSHLSETPAPESEPPPDAGP